MGALPRGDGEGHGDVELVAAGPLPDGDRHGVVYQEEAPADGAPDDPGDGGLGVHRATSAGGRTSLAKWEVTRTAPGNRAPRCLGPPHSGDSTGRLPPSGLA